MAGVLEAAAIDGPGLCWLSIGLIFLCRQHGLRQALMMLIEPRDKKSCHQCLSSARRPASYALEAAIQSMRLFFILVNAAQKNVTLLSGCRLYKLPAGEMPSRNKEALAVVMNGTRSIDISGVDTIERHRW